MKNLFFLVFILIGPAIFAQEKLNYPYVDKTTYDLYLKADWDSLIDLGDKSIDAGIDFYYLQVRMGVAYFEKLNYRKAIQYLQNAKKTNSDDAFVLELLYKSYIFSSRVEDARSLAYRFSSTLKDKLEIKEKPIFSAAYVETKFDQFDDYKATKSDTDNLEQTIKNNNSYFSINFENELNPTSKIFWGYSKINIDNTVYKLNESNEQINFTQEVTQNQLYFNYAKQFAVGSNFSFALNYIYSNFNDYDLVSRGAGYGGGYNSSSYDYISINAHEFASSISFYKDISNFKLGVNTAFSSLNESFQIQPGLNLTYYPLGNTNVYLLSKFTQHLDFKDNETVNASVFKQGVGFRLKTIYIEPYLSWGEIANFTKSNAFVVYNEDDFVKNQKGIKLYAYLLKDKLRLYTEFQQYDKINNYKVNNIDNQLIYKYQSIIAGIKWSF